MIFSCDFSESHSVVGAGRFHCQTEIIDESSDNMVCLNESPLLMKYIHRGITRIFMPSYVQEVF